MKKSLGPNTLAQPTPVWLVGSYDAQDKPNIMTVAWGGICCSKPACLGVGVRKERHTHPAIPARGGFTVSVPSQDQIREADYAGMVSGANVDKFVAAKLTAVKSSLVDAPYVGECPLVVECRLYKSVDLGAHTLFIGEILDVKAEESALGADGQIDLALLRPLIYSPGASRYFAVGEALGKGFSIGKSIGG